MEKKSVKKQEIDVGQELKSMALCLDKILQLLAKIETKLNGGF